MATAFPAMTSSDAAMTTQDTPTLTLDKRVLHHLSITLEYLEMTTDTTLNQTIKDAHLESYDILSLMQTTYKPVVQDNTMDNAEKCLNIESVLEDIYNVLSQYKNLIQDIPSYACNTAPLKIRLNSTKSLVYRLSPEVFQDTPMISTSTTPRDRLYTIQTLGAMEIQVSRIVKIVNSLHKC